MGILDPLKKTGRNVGSKTERIPDGFWAPVIGAFLIFAVGIISLIVDQPWLFPVLGTTAYLQVEQPGHERTRFYNVIIGHYIGIGAGLIGIVIFNLWNVPSIFMTYHLVPGEVGAAGIAVFLTIIINMFLRASHPPAASTTILISLGAITTLPQIVSLVIGISIIAIIGEAFRKIRIS